MTQFWRHYQRSATRGNWVILLMKVAVATENSRYANLLCCDQKLNLSICTIIYEHFGYMIVELNLNFAHLTNGFRTADRSIISWIRKLLNKIFIPCVSTYHGNSHFFLNARAFKGAFPPWTPTMGSAPSNPQRGSTPDPLENHTTRPTKNVSVWDHQK